MYGYEIFHEELMKNLIESVHAGTSSHAYIFEGEKGLGKHMAAQLFAAALTCADNNISPCGACPSCTLTKAGTNPDIIHVKPQKDKKTIGADDMRALEESVAIKPFNSNRKVYIIDDGSQLTEAAQNTFLKTFEEPPEYAVFIMVVENAASLLQTIISRFTLIHFPPVREETMRAYIEKNYPDEKERIPFLIKYCEGVPKRADSVINDSGFEDLRKVSLENLFLLLSSDMRETFDVQGFLDENKEKAEDIFDFWLSFMRDTALIQTGAAERIINIDKKDELRQLSSRFSPKHVVEMSERVIKAKEMLRRYVNLKAISLWLGLRTR